MIGRRHATERPTAGLVLTGGGARAAYQVGVLRAIADMLPPRSPCPFPVISGTSAGAINAAAIATHARRFSTGARGLERVWRHFRVGQVYEAGGMRLTRSATRWLAALFFSGLGTQRPDALLDNAPLRGLLARTIRFSWLREAIDRGDLRALSITCSSYTTGESVAFFQGAPDLAGWRRARREGRPAHIGVAHLMASSAIPAIFPPVRIGTQYYGDGAVRQLAPLSPALHLGADRILVVGVADNETAVPAQTVASHPPTVAEIAGHMLDSAFLDSLAADVERLERINRTLSLVPGRARRNGEIGLRPVETLVIQPSTSLTGLAAVHAAELPRAMRFYLRGSGADDPGSVVMSYLLFEAGFCRAAIRLGYSDALAREAEIMRFLGYEPAVSRGPGGAVPPDLW